MSTQRQPPAPIRTDAEYKAALRAVSPYFDNEPPLNSDEATRFQALVALIENYEAAHYPKARRASLSAQAGLEKPINEQMRSRTPASDRRLPEDSPGCHE